MWRGVDRWTMAELGREGGPEESPRDAYFQITVVGSMAQAASNNPSEQYAYSDVRKSPVIEFKAQPIARGLNV
jgi:hypothetical protein